MSKKDDGGPAFPGWTKNHYTDPKQEGGMTLRDYLAAKIVQGLFANPGGPIQANGISGWGVVNCMTAEVAKMAYSIADEMLEARKA